MILSHSHRLKQWVRLCENHREVKVLWNYLANSRLMIPSVEGVGTILTHLIYINFEYQLGLVK